VGKVALLFMSVFWILMAIPCVGVTWLGKNLIDRLGRYPSKTTAIQMSVFFKLIVIEVVSVTLILIFFKALISE
jgi:hypothetical protein